MAALSLAIAAQAQIGEPYIHDPSTLAECDGKYYTFGTGGGGLISDDGWSWHSGADRPGGGAAPDVLKIGDRYLCIYGATGGGRCVTPTEWRIRMPSTQVCSSILRRGVCG